MGLIIDSSTRRARVDEVMAVPTPARTKTWGAIGHSELLHTLRSATVEKGYDIIDEAYSLSKTGGRMFGVWALYTENSPDASRSIGFRNSIDKSMAVGITVGRIVTVCSNMMFKGDFVSYRKHNGSLDKPQLEYEATSALLNIDEQLLEFETWHDNLKQIELQRKDAELLLCRSVREGVLPEGQMGKFWRLYFDKKNPEKPKAIYEDNLHGFHGTITQIWNNNSLIGSGPRHRGLVKIIDNATKEMQTTGYITA